MSINLKSPKEFAMEFLEHYLARGLGSMTKRDLDILVVHLLDRHADISLEKNQPLSLRLRTTESRLRTLRYEARLRYPPEDKKYFERHLLYALVVAEFQAEKKQITFALEDQYLRHELQGRLKARGTFADSSFNSEIVKVRYDHLLTLLTELYGKDVTVPLSKAMEKAVGEEGKITFRALWKEFVLGAAKKLSSDTVDGVKLLLTTYVMSGS